MTHTFLENWVDGLAAMVLIYRHRADEGRCT